MSKTAKVWIGIVIVIIIIVIIAVSGGGSSTSSETIKIGYFGPLTGPAAASTGEDVANSFRLANSTQNKIGDRAVEVIYEDDACDPAKAVSAAKKLIEVDKVHIVVSGVCSGSSVAVAPIAELSKVVLLTPISESPKLTTAGDYIFRTSASSVVSAHAMVEALAQLSYSKVSILFENAEYTVGMKDAFVNEFKTKQGALVLDAQGFESKSTDLRTQLSLLSKTNAEIFIFFMNSSITANIVSNQMKDLKINKQVLANNYYTVSQSLENPNNDGFYVVTYSYDKNAPALLALSASYKEKFGKPAHNDFYAALGYDGYMVLFNAMKACNGDDAECVKSELYKVKDYQGVTGTITIDQNGDTAREFRLQQIKSGQLVDVK